MIKILRRGAKAFETVALDAAQSLRLPDDVVWIELIAPTREEDHALEAVLGVTLPTREEMVEIEPSSRLYQEDGATYLTAIILHRSEAEAPMSEPITFVLTGGRLVTIRYVEPKAFGLFKALAERQPEACSSGARAFLGLVEAIVDRNADILERTGSEVEEVSRAVFSRPKERRFDQLLTQLGRAQNVNAKARDSLVSLSRLVSFAALAVEIEKDAEAVERLQTLARDVHSLTDHASYVSTNITFLLDAALGLINIEQSSIIKIFSIAAVVFLPPTLVASIYGMNFHHMPELGWPFGYPMALGLMVLSAALPLWWFRRKGWF